MVLAPEGQYVQELKENIENWEDVESYIVATSKKTELERQTEKEKTGVEVKGVKAVNPANGEEIPIWVADYVIATYGTGAIMAVPAHDERDFEFAKKYKLPIKQVVESIKYYVSINKEEIDLNGLFTEFSSDDIQEFTYNGKYTLEAYDKNLFIKALKKYSRLSSISILSGVTENIENWYKKEEEKEIFCYPNFGISINSEFLNRLTTQEAKEKMIDWLEEHNVGKRKIQYKLRDWSVSRQRFWGAPLPMVVNEQLSISKKQYVFIHGYGGDAQSNFFPWMKQELEAKGHTVVLLDLPNTDKPNVKEQADFLKEKISFNENTVIVAHSLGGPVAFRILENLGAPIAKLILADPVFRPEFNDGERSDVTASDSFVFDFEKIKANADAISIISDAKHVTIKKEHIDELSSIFNARHIEVDLSERHLMVAEIPALLEEALMTGVKPVPFSDLPVLLPEDVDFKPTGQSPLTYSKTFQEGVEEKYGNGPSSASTSAKASADEKATAGTWKREVNTLDTFMCSSWYFFRYLDPHNEKEFASPEALKTWMPVDFYLGGPEHVNGHLLYSRFFTKVLFDAGYIDFDEPFTVHRHQGLILGPDGRKMSKRWGNVINPSDVVDVYGADTMRMYEMFMGPLEDDKPWDDAGVRGVRRFLDRVWNLQDVLVKDEEIGNLKLEIGDLDKETHKVLKKVGDDLATLNFNTAIAKLMELTNAFYKVEKVPITNYILLITMLAPFAPHMAEELWQLLGHDTQLAFAEWPQYDESKLVSDTMTIAVQVNGKVRATIDIASDASEDDVKATAMADENVKKWMGGNEPKKVIYVKGKIVNVVV